MLPVFSIGMVNRRDGGQNGEEKLAWVRCKNKRQYRDPTGGVYREKQLPV
jgi:hypothetical protein